MAGADPPQVEMVLQSREQQQARQVLPASHALQVELRQAPMAQAAWLRVQMEREQHLAQSAAQSVLVQPA